MSSMKDSQPWSHMFARATDGTYLKNFCQSIPKQFRNKEKKKTNGNCKAFCVRRNRKKLFYGVMLLEDNLTELIEITSHSF